MSNLYKSLALSMRALSLAARPATTTTTLPALQTRCLSQAILAKTAAPTRTTTTPCCSSHAAPVVRRKASKRSNGYLYIICPANPRHKQRQS
ncbi:hypothetical protein N0V88_006048 [Collariella sp. IMI 366227]|nr:hypothetical protein N0V88_006048 [Collariella sp. IMI 366227]